MQVTGWGQELPLNARNKDPELSRITGSAAIICGKPRPAKISKYRGFTAVIGRSLHEPG